MKTKIFFVCLVCCITWQVNAQAFNNTIVNDNSSWAILGYGVCPECPVWTQYVYFDSDSIFVDYSYKKVFSCYDKLHENIEYEGLIREQNKKTYFVPVNSEKEHLLYDFSLEEGMNFEYVEPLPNFEPPPVTFYVKKVDFVEINGVQKKRIQLAEDSFPYDENAPTRITWIEGIGSLNGLFEPCGILAPGGIRALLCYHQNNELVYKNPAYTECYYDKPITSVQIITINDCNIFPNPVDNVLYISCLNNVISRTEIFDNTGRQVYNQAYKGTINVNSFSKGLYLLKLYGANGQVSELKFIKK